MPKVSVIIPTYNRASLLELAIQSVLEQTFRDFELIIVDDASTDDTSSVVLKYQERIRHFRHQKNNGRATARNKGLEMARGEYVAWLDSDDLWKPDRLERGVWVLDQKKDIDLLHGEVDVIDMNGKLDERETERMKQNYQKARRRKADFLNIMRHYPIFSSSVLFRKKCLPGVGLFDSRCNILEDYDWYLRFSLKYPILLLNGGPIASYRIHKGNVSQEQDSRKIAREYIQILQRRFILMQQEINGSAFRKVGSGMLEKIAEFHCSNDEMTETRLNLLKALKLNPTILLHWRSVSRLIRSF